jgi:hypothetical protein
MQWFAPKSRIIATYFNHFYGSRRRSKQWNPTASSSEFGLALRCTFYWLLFRLSYVYLGGRRGQERLSTVAALLNSFGLMGLLRYQSVHPEWAFRTPLRSAQSS